MDTTNTQVMSLRLSAEEIEKIDAAAAKTGMSRPDYVRSKLLMAPASAPAIPLQETLNYLIYMVENLHLSTYLIAEKSAVLLPEQLQEILKRATGEATYYVSTLDQHMAQMKRLVATFQDAKA